jgi:hypothetical protein
VHTQVRWSYPSDVSGAEVSGEPLAPVFHERDTGATHLDGGTRIAELTPSGKYNGQILLRCEVAGEVVGHAATSTLTDIPGLVRAAASGPVPAQVAIGDFDGTPWSGATALTD